MRFCYTFLIFSSTVYLGVVSISHPAFAADDAGGQYLFGDWGGVRSDLEEHGLAFESILTLDEMGNVAGGAKEGSRFLGNYDLTATLYTDKAGLWDGGTFFTYVLADFGQAPSELVGDTQVTDNIEAPETIKLFEAWYNQDLFDKKLSILFGLHDIASEFYVTNFSGNLINSSFGIGVDISQIGISIFPTTSLGARLKVVPFENTYVQAALYDGVPGNPNNSHGTHIRLGHDDGVLWIGEAGLQGEDGPDYYKAGLGIWNRTTDFEDFSEAPRSSNTGIYSVLEKSLYVELAPSEEGGVTQGLGGFLRLGFAQQDRNQIAENLSAGLMYTGLIPDRDEDLTSFGVSYARNGSDFVSTDEAVLDAETAVEINYHAAITPYFALTPDVQWVIDPGTTRGADDALALTLRAEIAM